VGVSAITANTSRTYASGTFAWNRSDIELTKIIRGAAHRRGTSSAAGCTVSPNPGPEVRGSPSRWYFADPIALSRPANVNA